MAEVVITWHIAILKKSFFLFWPSICNFCVVETIFWIIQALVGNSLSIKGVIFHSIFTVLRKTLSSTVPNSECFNSLTNAAMNGQWAFQVLEELCYDVNLTYTPNRHPFSTRNAQILKLFRIESEYSFVAALWSLVLMWLSMNMFGRT